MQSSVSSTRLIATVRRHRSLDVVHENRFATTFFQAHSEKICACGLHQPLPRPALLQLARTRLFGRESRDVDRTRMAN